MSDAETLTRSLESERRARQEAERRLEQQDAELSEARAALAAAQHDLQRTRDQLLQSDKMASIGQLAAGVAHEINNPIGFISSNLNCLRDYAKQINRVIAAYDELLDACKGDDSPLAVRAQSVEKVRHEAELEYILADLSGLISESIEGSERVCQIVANLRDFSHVDNPDVREADVNELIEKTTLVARNVLKYKADIVREFGDVPPLPCYGGRLGQVFLNLLVNAAQAIENHGTITVRTAHRDGMIRIELADTGCGIAPENLTRIFEPFFTTKDVGQGTGLGLHLAHTIVHAHGGRIGVESTVGKGTTFRIELPVSGPPHAQEQANELAA
ncbi:MAG: ATP-binding protein [Planctomycetota bacterium]|jgi:signal transduction histidine kinase